MSPEDSRAEFVADRFGPACVQTELHPQACPIYREDFARQVENCLSLNVWAPTDARGAAVLVWIHGGALIYGGSASPMFDGARLAAEGLVVVTLNYRLGVLGFLAHAELSAESPEGISGNYGLLDQVAALQWVKRNIAAFGGDPDNVTVAGESAGALSIVCLMGAPAKQPLFHKAILQSPYMISLPTLGCERHGHPSAESAGDRFVRRIGAESVADLRNMPAEDLVRKAATSGFAPWPTVDRKLIPRQLVETFASGEQANIPVIAGFNGGEIRSLRRLLPPRPSSAQAYENHIRAAYGDLSDTFLREYPAADLDGSMLAATRDAMYGWSAQTLAAAQSRLGAASYLYLFDHGYPAAEAVGLKSFHAAELPFVFGTMKAVPAEWPEIPDTPEQRHLSNAMIEYWSAFAKTAQPRSENGPDWPCYAPGQEYMLFDRKPTIEPDDLCLRLAIHGETVSRRRLNGDIPWHWNIGFAAPLLDRNG